MMKEDIESVTVKEDMALICAVGDSLLENTGVAAKVFAVVAEIGANVEMISEGASDVALNFVVPSSRAIDVIRKLHEMYIRVIWMRDFKSDKGQMIIGGVKATDIAAKFGTPVYVTDEDALRGNFRRIDKAFQKNMPTRIHYACKANTNLSLLRILQQEGSCIDAVSVERSRLCLKAGFTPDRILYTGVMVSDMEMQQVVDLGIPINVDSINQLRRLAVMDNSHPISFRVNPGVGAGHHQHVVTGAKTTKFGVPKEQILDTYQEALSLGFKPFGIHAHIGAGVQETAPFLQVTQVLVDIANEIRDHLGLALETIDIGGGIGIPYHLEDNHMDVGRALLGSIQLHPEQLLRQKTGHRTGPIPGGGHHGTADHRGRHQGASGEDLRGRRCRLQHPDPARVLRVVPSRGGGQQVRCQGDLQLRHRGADLRDRGLHRPGPDAAHDRARGPDRRVRRRRIRFHHGLELQFADRFRRRSWSRTAR